MIGERAPASGMSTAEADHAVALRAMAMRAAAESARRHRRLREVGMLGESGRIAATAASPAPVALPCSGARRRARQPPPDPSRRARAARRRRARPPRGRRLLEQHPRPRGGVVLAGDVASSSRFGFTTVAPARAAARSAGPVVSTITARRPRSSGTRPRNVGIEARGKAAVRRRPRRAPQPNGSATSRDASAGARASPCSLKIVLPFASSTTATARRVAGDGTSRGGGRGGRAPRRSRAPVAPPAGARASTGWPSGASTRATSRPLPPARDAPAGTRWVSPGSAGRRAR